MITKATYAGSSNTMCEIEPSMDIVPVDDPQVVEWVDAGNTIFPYAPPAQTADEARAEKYAELKATYEQEAITPVISGISTWNGGEASAHRINGKAETMLHSNVALGSIHDINNTPHQMDATAMKDIAADISIAYEVVFVNYQAKKNEVVACGDDAACINAVVW